jgi:hypothetical protein
MVTARADIGGKITDLLLTTKNPNELQRKMMNLKEQLESTPTPQPFE